MNILRHPYPAKLSDLYSTEADAARLSQQILICNSLLYISFGAALAGYLPFWALLIVIPLLLVRWILFVHDLFHLRKATQVNLVIQLLPILLTPLSLGYREYQEIHSHHHRFMATPQDPEYYQIRGSKLVGFLNALTSPEQAYFRWLGTKGMDGQLLRDSLLRLALFGAIVAFAKWSFLWFWLPSRIVYGFSYFIFFYCLHRQGKDYGVYPLHLPPLLQSWVVLLFGRHALLEICYHDAHHAHPRVAPEHLPGIAP